MATLPQTTLQSWHTAQPRKALSSTPPASTSTAVPASSSPTNQTNLALTTSTTTSGKPSSPPTSPPNSLPKSSNPSPPQERQRHRRLQLHPPGKSNHRPPRHHNLRLPPLHLQRPRPARHHPPSHLGRVPTLRLKRPRRPRRRQSRAGLRRRRHHRFDGRQ